MSEDCYKCDTELRRARYNEEARWVCPECDAEYDMYEVSETSTRKFTEALRSSLEEAREIIRSVPQNQAIVSWLFDVEFLIGKE